MKKPGLTTWIGQEIKIWLNMVNDKVYEGTDGKRSNI